MITTAAIRAQLPPAQWLDGTDFEAIAAAVDRMQARIARDERPLPFGAKTTLLGAGVEAEGGSPTPRQIRARTALGKTCQIHLKPFPLWDEDVALLKADPAGFRVVMIGILAHEATHVRQWTVGGDPGEHQRSDSASALAISTKVYENYIAYIATPLELAAHATHLAAEVWAGSGDALGEADFRKTALLTGIWDHMTDHPESRPVCPASGAALFEQVGEPLLALGWWMYQRLM